MSCLKLTNEGDQKMTRPILAGFKKKALKNPEVRAEYEALSPAHELRKKRIAFRKAAGAVG